MGCFTTYTIDDNHLEMDEIYLLTLTSDEPRLTLDPSVATVTILDDDSECILWHLLLSIL